MMMDYERIQKITENIREKTDFKADIAIILGSGLAGVLQEVQAELVIPYSEIEGFPVPTVEGHPGKMIFGYLCGQKVIALAGRTHYYECQDMGLVTMAVRVIGMLGIRKLILTNAAGGISPKLKQGDIMILEDHISSFVPSPLMGENCDSFGPRFPDMTHVYDASVVDRVMERAGKNNLELKKGVYLQTTGPNYETPAEIRMYAAMGADAVGMSTACEAITAGHMGMTVCGLSCITNMAAGLGNGSLSHKEVENTALKAQDCLKEVMKEAVCVMSEL